LNLSITEAFCLANLEAISSGIYVVSTDVGGVAEVLPDTHFCLVQPEINYIIKSLSEIIETQRYKNKKNSRELIKKYYNWERVADETVVVYEEVIKTYEHKDISLFSKETLLNPVLIFISFFGFINKMTFSLYN
jgi:phosphatidylinositol glycan class A protein